MSYTENEFNTVYELLSAYVVPRASAHGLSIYELSDLILRRIKLSEQNRAQVLMAERPRAQHPSEAV